MVYVSELWPGAIRQARRIIELLKRNGFIIFDREGCTYKHTGLRLDAAGEEELLRQFHGEIAEGLAEDLVLEFEF